VLPGTIPEPKKTSRDPLPPEAESRVPARLLAIARKAMAVRPEDRYPTVDLDHLALPPELVLVPKEKGAAPLELRLGLDPETLFPDETRLQVGGLRVKTVLSGIVFNPRLEAATFRFTPPEGSDVFRNFKPPQIQP